MDESTRERLINPNIWLRGLYMIFFFVAYKIAEVILLLLGLFQFVTVLFTGKANEPLLRFGRNLAVFVEQVFEFLTFNVEDKPFPFEPFPDEPLGGEIWLQDQVLADDSVAMSRASDGSASPASETSASEADTAAGESSSTTVEAEETVEEKDKAPRQPE